MTERCFLLNELTAVETLDVLAALPDALPTLADAGLRFEATGRGYGRLVVPDPGVRAGVPEVRRARLAALARLRTEVARVRPPLEEDTAQIDLSDGRFLPLDRLPVRLVSDSGRHGEPAEPIGGEALVLVDEPDQDVAWAVFDALLFHPTAVRVTAGQDAAGRVLHLFHLRDDTLRDSSFAALEASGRLANAVLLAGFAEAGPILFLPAARPPGRRALALFGEVVRASPALFGLPERAVQRGGEPLLALDDRGSGAVYSLERLHFRDKAELYPPEVALAALEIHSLEETPEALERLGQRIRDLVPPVGYELELRRLAPGPADDASLERIREKIAFLEEQASYVAGLGSPRHLLLRFTQHQLAALADALRRFPLPDIDRGLILYGFQASTRAPAGIHYLLIDPASSMMTGPFPESYWRDVTQDQPIAFRIDPFFAFNYAAAPGPCHVFVPDGHALFPPLHSWNEDGIADYLRAVMSQWFHGQSGVQTIPARPAYLFAPDGGRVAVEVLDLDAFRPVTERVGWLNHNLLLVDRVSVEELIERMASAKKRAALAQEMEMEAARAEDAVAAAAAATSARVSDQLTELAAMMAEEIEEASAHAGQTLNRIGRMHANLDLLDRVLAELEGRQRAIEQAVDTLLDESGLFEKRRDELAGSVASLLETTGSLIDRLEGEVMDRVLRLRNVRDRLRDALSSPYGGRLR